jgi:hypothetical protein
MVVITEAKLKQLQVDLSAPSHLTRSKAFLTLKTFTAPSSSSSSSSSGNYKIVSFVIVLIHQGPSLDSFVSFS